MLSRRHIRIKVMQSLYSFLSTKDSQLPLAEKAMLKHFNEVVELKLVVLSLLIEIVKYANNFYEDGKKKHLPNSSDLDPNTKFVNNKIVCLIRENDSLMTRISKVSGIWLNNDHDIARKLFNVIIKSDLYINYLGSQNLSLKSEKKFIIDLLNDFVLNHELVHHILEERSIYWIDDLPFVATILMSGFKDRRVVLPKSVFKNKTDKDFAISLFDLTIRNDQEYEDIIVKKAKNWDLERIAIMDQILIKMAFCEILNMPELPIKVSLNEYIEISKYYSTNKSKMFINGLLDSAITDFKDENKIIKTGRGLM